MLAWSIQNEPRRYFGARVGEHARYLVERRYNDNVMCVRYVLSFSTGARWVEMGSFDRLCEAKHCAEVDSEIGRTT